MRYALASFRFARGISILTRNPVDNDTLEIAQNENVRFLSDARNSTSAVWEQGVIQQSDPSDVISFLEGFAARRDHPSRTIVFPLGPKPIVVQSILTSLSAEDADVWVSYPVPALYSAGYSMGAGATHLWKLVDSRS